MASASGDNALPPAAAAASAAAPAATASASASASAPQHVSADSQRNRLAAPGLLSDPFTAFDVDEEAGYLCTGSASGAISLWRLDHLSDLLLGTSRSSEDLAAGGEEIVCRALCSSSDEGVKHLFLNDEQVFAVIGDASVRIWGSWHDASSQSVKFARTHEYKTCKQSYSLRWEQSILVITVDSNEGVLLNLESMEQRPFKLHIRSDCVPQFFNGTHLFLMQVALTGAKLLQVYEVVSQRLVNTLLFDKPNHFYWGFQLFNAAAPKPAAAAIAASPAVESKSEDSASSSLMLSYISLHSIIKCIPFSSIPPALTVAELATVPRDRPSTHSLFTHKIHTAAAGARILAYMHDEATQTFTVLLSDAKIKVFAMSDGKADAKGKVSAGRLLHKYRGLAGTFKLGYPYLIKLVSPRIIAYSADEGIYLLRR